MSENTKSAPTVDSASIAPKAPAPGDKLTFDQFAEMCTAAGIEASPDEMQLDYNFGEALSEVTEEIYAAVSSYPPFNSAHEGMGVLREEVDELWDEVKVKQGKRDIAAMRHEACQVAAMAIRFMAEICRDGVEDK